MKATLIQSMQDPETGLPAKLLITITNHREKLLLMSLSGAYVTAILQVVNNPETTFIAVGEEEPFTQAEVIEFTEKVRQAFI